MERGYHEQRAGQQPTGGASTDVPPSDPDVFTAVFTRSAPALYDFLARLSGRTEAADALLRQSASQSAMNVASAPQWPSVRAWLFSRAAALLPGDTNAANTDFTRFGDPNLALLPPSPPDSGLTDMARVVWRAVSALSTDQHALLHLHVRTEMPVGEAGSVLGIHEREAGSRLDRVIAAVEETSRALFLIRYGRGRDPRLNELLAGRNVTRLTPDLRGFLEDYLRTTPSAQAMLNAVPDPLRMYAAFRPLPIPESLAAAAAREALPWLTSVATVSAAPSVAAATTALPDQEPQAATGVLPQETVPLADSFEAEGRTAFTPIPPAEYGTQHYAAGGYDPYAFDTSYSAPPTGSGAIDGTQMLDIPVRQRVVSAQSAVFVPPRRPPPRGPNPLAILGAVGGALVIVIGALVIFLSRSSGQPNVRVTATVGASATPSAIVSVVPDALLTSTAISLNRLLTATALAATPTAIPAVIPPILNLSTPTPAPQPIRTNIVDVGTPAASPAASTIFATDAPGAGATSAPRITQAPVEMPAPRVTAVPTRAMVVRVTPAEVTTRAATGISTTIPTVVATAAPTVVATAVPTAAPPAPPTAVPATATAVKPAAPAPTASGATATTGPAKPIVIPTPNTPPVSADNTFVTVGTNNSGSVTVTNKSAATTFTASSNNSHITVSPANGNLPAGGNVGLTININRAGLAAGPYSGAVTVTTGNGNVTVLVSFTVS